jgi:hypothetical protein
MTAKQKAARAKFKAVVAEAKKLRKKNPKLTQAQAVKQAWAISYSKERKGEKLGADKKAKYEIGDMVYSYQNKNYKAPISYKKFVPWESLSKPSAKDKFVYKLKIKDGFSNWINEESLSKSILGAAPTKVKAKKSKRTSEMHTDTKSHNVNIRVMSGYKKIGNTSTVEVGDIFVCSWGYDQTNIDFYKVVKKTKTGVSIVPMSKKVIEYSDRYMTGKVLPGEVFVGSKPMRRKLNKYGDKFYISINSFSSAKKWSGMPETFTTYA